MTTERPAAADRLDGFTGRKTALSRACGWLATASSGVLVVAGPPGAGKSALLAKLAELSAGQPGGQAPAGQAGGQPPAGTADAGMADDLVLPPVGSITASIDARSQTFAEVQAAVADAIGTPIAPGAVELVARATGVLSPTLVVDSVDEVARGDVVAVAMLLADLASIGFRVVVGLRPDARPDLDSRATVSRATGRDATVSRAAGTPGPRCDVLAAVFHEATVIRLDEPALVAENYRDVADFVTGRLLANGAEADPAAEAGTGLAYAVSGNFLAARLAVAPMLRGSPGGWRAAAAAAAGQAEPFGIAVEFDLRQLPGPVRDVVRPMLTGLAWAQGGGADEAAWPVLASAVTGRRFGPADVALTIDHAGWYVCGGDRAGLRLMHEELARYFRRVTCHEY